MKKGFTLIELLIIMVIVAILVTMALPRYKAAMEKGRGLEGIAAGAAISDAINLYYVKNYNSYGSSWKTLCVYALGDPDCYPYQGVAATTGTLATNFGSPSISVESTGKATVQLSRLNLGAKQYKLFFVNEAGETTERYCTGYQKYCNILGATTARSGGGWSF